jgi:titin
MKNMSTKRLLTKVVLWATLGVLGFSTTVGVEQLSATASQIPVITSVTSDASQQITINWTPPTDTDFTGYKVRYRMSTATIWEEASLPSTSATSYIVNGLTNGTAYQVQLGAVYSAQLVDSAISNDVVPYGLPNAPVMTELVSEASGELTVRWTAPSSDGGRLVTEYKATTGVDAESCTVSSSATECTITNLVNGTSYSVTVAAKNERGYGASSLSLSEPPFGFAGAPTGVSGVPGNQQVDVSWTAPASTGGSVVTGYVVTGSPSGTCSTSGLTCTVAGLTNGTSYTFSVKATNARGDSVASVSSSAVIPRTTPGAPTSLVATAGDASASIAFTEPSTGGSAITNYEYSTTNGTSWKALIPADTTTPVVIAIRSDAATALVNGTTYNVKLRAVNIAGTGTESDVVSTTPVASATVPGAPTGVSGVPGNQQVDVSWTAPASTGGSVVTGYVVTGSPSGTCSTSGLTCTVAGLTNGTSYTFSVKATNARGDSVASVSSSAVIPRTTPGAPTSLVATAGDASASVAFTAPSSTGGADISNYEYSSDNGTSWKALSPADATSPVSISVRSDSNAALVNGTVYQVKLRAVNTAGNGTDSDAVSITPVAAITVPGAPTSLVATAGDASASVAFTEPSSTGGSAITNYKYSTDNGTSWKAFSPADAATPVVITIRSDAATALVNGTTYNVKLRAVNSVGDGTASSTVSVTPTSGVVLAVPGAPTSLVATAGDASASVAFTAPSSTGGAPILEYIVRAIPTTSGQTKACSTTTTLRCELTNLVNNVQYTVVVVAKNSVGESANSNSISIFPVAPPSVQVLQSLPESLALPNNSPAPGESIVLTFSGFTPFEWVVITLQSTPTVLNSLQADSSGVITTSVVLPSSTSLGSHTLSLLGLTSGTGARKTITVSSAAQSSFISLSEPKRVVDTRGGGRFGSTSLSKVSVKRVQVFGALTTDGAASGLPASGVGAVALNVTAVNGFDDGGYGFVTVYPCESDSTVAPNSSNLNFAGGQTIPNAVIAPVSSNGYVCFSVYGNTDLLVDVSGYFGS